MAKNETIPGDYLYRLGRLEGQIHYSRMLDEDDEVEIAKEEKKDLLNEMDMLFGKVAVDRLLVAIMREC